MQAIFSTHAASGSIAEQRSSSLLKAFEMSILDTVKDLKSYLIDKKYPVSAKIEALQAFYEAEFGENFPSASCKETFVPEVASKLSPFAREKFHEHFREKNAADWESISRFFLTHAEFLEKMGQSPTCDVEICRKAAMLAALEHGNDHVLPKQEASEIFSEAKNKKKQFITAAQFVEIWQEQEQKTLLYPIPIDVIRELASKFSCNIDSLARKIIHGIESHFYTKSPDIIARAPYLTYWIHFQENGVSISMYPKDINQAWDERQMEIQGWEVFVPLQVENTTPVRPCVVAFRPSDEFYQEKENRSKIDRFLLSSRYFCPFQESTVGKILLGTDSLFLQKKDAEFISLKKLVEGNQFLGFSATALTSFFIDIVEGLTLLDANKIAYLDLDLENIVLKKGRADAYVAYLNRFVQLIPFSSDSPYKIPEELISQMDAFTQRGFVGNDTNSYRCIALLADLYFANFQNDSIERKAKERMILEQIHPFLFPSNYLEIETLYQRHDGFQRGVIDDLWRFAKLQTNEEQAEFLKEFTLKIMLFSEIQELFCEASECNAEYEKRVQRKITSETMTDLYQTVQKKIPSLDEVRTRLRNTLQHIERKSEEFDVERQGGDSSVKSSGEGEDLSSFYISPNSSIKHGAFSDRATSASDVFSCSALSSSSGRISALSGEENPK